MKTLITLFSLFFSSLLFAQETENYGFIPIEIGLRQTHFRDKFSSPNVYKGWGLLFGIGNEIYGKNDVQRLGASGAFVSTKSDTKSAFSLENNVNDGNFYYSYEPLLHTEKNTSYFVGIRLDFIISGRDNKPTSFDSALVLSAVASAAYSGNNDWLYRGSVRLPLLAYAVRPPVATTGYYLAEKKTHKKYFSKLLTIPQYFGIDFKTEFTKITDNGNGLRGSYRWRYYQITPLNKLQVVQSDFNFGLLWGY